MSFSDSKNFRMDNPTQQRTPDTYVWGLVSCTTIAKPVPLITMLYALVCFGYCIPVSC